MPPKKSNAPEGEVVLVNKPEVKPEPPEPAIKEITPTQYNALKPKKELSEKQQANLAKLIERNKARAIARHAVVSDAIPEVVPEDKVLVKVKAKRVYNKKPKNEVVEPTPEPAPSESESEPEPEPKKARPKKPVAPKRAKEAPKPKKYRYETETSDCESDDSDSDYEDQKVQKYAHKAQRRLEAVKHIDNRLKELNSGNPYAARNLSLF